MNEQITPDRLAEIERCLLAEWEGRELAAKGPSDLEFFARAALKLRPKVGAVQPFVFNAAGSTVSGAESAGAIVCVTETSSGLGRKIFVRPGGRVVAQQ